MAPAADRLDACLAFTLREEGGWADDPRDPGGATMEGITLATFRAWRRDDAASPAELHAIGADEVRAIYGANYFQAAACDRLPPGLDLAVFDAAVNAGVRRAAMQLQQAVGAVPDGHVGPVTVLAAGALAAGATLDRMRVIQEAFYRSLATFPTFGRGWLARLDRRFGAARAMAGVAVKAGADAAAPARLPAAPPPALARQVQVSHAPAPAPAAPSEESADALNARLGGLQPS